MSARLPAESTELEADNPADAAGTKQARMLDICALAQSVMETALKSLIHALEGDHPDRTHDIGGLIRHAIASGLTGPQARRLRAALGDVPGDKASVWREVSTYLGDLYLPGDPDDATPQFAADMATAAVNIAHQCAHLTDTALGTETPNSADVKRLATQTKTRIPLINPQRRPRAS